MYWSYINLISHIHNQCRWWSMRSLSRFRPRISFATTMSLPFHSQNMTYFQPSPKYFQIPAYSLRVYRKCEKERKGTKRNEKERKGTKRNEKERKGTKRNEV
uniref:Uncharacterized protein n=1 Tax=Branchiostoma floridae TaxID=7739 RepID=C3Y3T0_BRAFL|eukprot:XP_002608946.1 hypothetical protein BRAFLDRAFT_85479 [Branchiostoma floridae]